MLTLEINIIQKVDDRRQAVVLKNQTDAVQFAAENWIKIGQDAIAKRGRYAVALSGGTTPNAIYSLLASEPYKRQIDWSKVLLFWSDERAVDPEHPDSNYHSAMDSGLSRLPILKEQIFRMKAETQIDRAAEEYEALIRRRLGVTLFDLVMLGIGVDGHTASLFPNTVAIKQQERLVVANLVPELKTWRMTLTIPCINQSWRTVFYAFGRTKQTIVSNVLHAPRISEWPASQIGTVDRPALWVLDQNSAALVCK